MKILAHVRAEHPDLEGPFLANVHQGREEILHRLLQALVRENVAGISSRVSWRSGVGERSRCACGVLSRSAGLICAEACPFGTDLAARSSRTLLGSWISSPT